MSCGLRPRNDFVLVREERVEEVRGVAMPEVSAEGKRYVVVAMGKDVKELSVGESVILNGQLNVHWSYVPRHPDLIIVRQECVILVIESSPDGDGCQANGSAYEQLSMDDFHA